MVSPTTRERRRSRGTNSGHLWKTAMEQRSSPVAMAQGRGGPLMTPSRRKTASRGRHRHRPAQAEKGFRLDLNPQSSEDARCAGRRPERRWRGGCAAPPWWSHQLASGGEGKSGGPSRAQDRRLQAPSKQRGGGTSHRRGAGAHPAGRSRRPPSSPAFLRTPSARHARGRTARRRGPGRCTRGRRRRPAGRHT